MPPKCLYLQPQPTPTNMNYKQGDLVDLSFPVPLPDGQSKPHPVLIISSDSCNKEGFYTAVMMTSSENFRDQFSFPCEHSMFEKKLEKDNCHFRMFILVSFCDRDVYKKRNHLRSPFLKKLLNEIKETVFCRDSI